LDSLQDEYGSRDKKEGRLLQTILLKHFEGASFMDGRIATNVSQASYFIFSTFVC
jgi:hypothetical protein